MTSASPENITMVITNWVLGILSLACVVSLLIFPLATIISALVEGNKQLAPGEVRRWKKTKIFGILSGLAIVGLIVILVLWGIVMYVARTASVY